MPTGPVARAPPDAAPALGFARPEGKSAPHTTGRDRTVLPAEFRAAHESLAGSTDSIVLTVVRSDRFALRSARGRPPTWFSGSRRPATCRIVHHHCARQSSQSDYSG